MIVMNLPKFHRCIGCLIDYLWNALLPLHIFSAHLSWLNVEDHCKKNSLYQPKYPYQNFLTSNSQKLHIDQILQFGVFIRQTADKKQMQVWDH